MMTTENKLANPVQMNRMEADRLVVADRIRKDYGTIPIELAGKNPDENFSTRISLALIPSSVAFLNPN